MRTRDKLDSYRVLAEALALPEGPAVAGAAGGRRAGARRGRGPDGAARRRACASPAPCRTRSCRRFMPRADLYLWPAINEAYGMAFLEAQAAGLPVVAGRTGGVPAVVADGVTGLADADRRCRGLCRRRRPAARRRRTSARGWPPRAARVSPPTMTNAPRPVPWPPRCGRCDERVPFAILRHAATAWNEERRLQGLTDTPLSAAGEADARRWRLPAPADGWQRMSQPLAARPAHGRAGAAVGAGHRRFAPARDELRRLGRPHASPSCARRVGEAFVAAERWGSTSSRPAGNRRARP